MDFMKMMQAAKSMQANMAAMKDEIAAIEVTGVSAGGMVTMTVSGKGEIRSLTIDPALVKPEEKEILEDLVIAAQRDALAKVETAIQERMAGMADKLGLPAGMKLPF
jgi:DNA-binding YbaB/EbfC family protein